MRRSVLHVIPSISRVHGGPSRAVEAMDQALRDAGWQVVVATTDDDGPGRRLSAPAKIERSPGGGKVVYFRKHLDFYKVAIHFVPWILREVGHFEVVHIHALFSFTSVVAAWAARIRGVPYVIRPLGTLARYGMTQRRPWLKQLSFRFIEGPIVRRAAAVHFTSLAEQDEATALKVPFRAEVIPLGFPTSESAPAQRPFPPKCDAGKHDPLRLLYLSRLDPVKNLESLIASLKLVQQGGIQSTLVIGGAGEGKYVNGLQSLALREGLADKLEWLGHVSGPAKQNALAGADLFCLPSYSENFGIAVVEALQAGLPCILGKGVAIATDVELAGAGVVVEGSAESIAEAILHYANSPIRRRQASQAARALAAREYTSTRMAQRLGLLYDSVVMQSART